MPSFLVPHRSGAHRVAAIALYRALLTQCRAAPFDAARRRELEHMVQNRFRDARALRTPRRLTLHFAAGYEAIDHLDAAVGGDRARQAHILSLLARAPDNIKAPPPPPRHRQRPRPPPDAATPTSSIFDRRPLPREKLSGPRHVPVLFSANRIPVLRFGKPQPPALSKYIRARLAQRQGRIDRRDRLEGERTLARAEDDWDKLVERLGGGGSGPPGPRDRDGVGWTTAVDQALIEVDVALAAEKDKNRVMAGKMQALVDRERELAERENEQGHGRADQTWETSSSGADDDTITEKTGRP